MAATLSSSTSSSQSYYLRFSSHTAALSRSLLNLLSESYCTDVHISTGHQSQTIRAHKIILSAFSPYFKALFANLPNNQFPVIIIREISYDILRTIIEFCYRGEILVSRDKLDDIVSAAKFLQIEGAKDFIIPKQHTYGSHTTSTQQMTKMQIDLQAKLNQAKNLHNVNVLQNSQSLPQTSSQRAYSLLSKSIQKPPNVSITKTITIGGEGDNIKISGLRHLNEHEYVNLEDDDDDDEGDDEDSNDDNDCQIEENENNLEPKKKLNNDKSITDKLSKGSEKSGMFSEFEDQVYGSGGNNANYDNNSTATQSAATDSKEQSRDEPMDTTNMGQILAKVPAGTSVSTTTTSTADNSSVTNVPIPLKYEVVDDDDDDDDDEEEEFDDEEEQISTNPLDICNVNLSETEETIVPHVDPSLHLSSATARAIAASTFASFNQMEMESEGPSTSQVSTPINVAANIGRSFNSHSGPITTITSSSERRGRGRPPKYGPNAASSHPSISAAASSQMSSQLASQSASPVTMSMTTRSRRGRPPSMPEDLLRSLTGRLDKAHHKCPHCPQIYYGYHAMRDHITSVHLNSGEKYICNLCNKEYTWRITLRKHLKFHHGVHPDQVPNT